MNWRRFFPKHTHVWQEIPQKLRSKDGLGMMGEGGYAWDPPDGTTIDEWRICEGCGELEHRPERPA